jgi:hypothetical protein
MGRAKNKKANNPPAAAKSEQPPSSSEPTAAPPVDSDTNEQNIVLASLQPYLTLLPALRGVGLAKQRVLHEALYTAGSTAAQALESYLKDKSVVMKQLEGAAAESGESSVRL